MIGSVLLIRRVAVPGGGGEALAGQLCTDVLTKNDEKEYFFRTGQGAALSSFRVGKMLFL